MVCLLWLIAGHGALPAQAGAAALGPGGAAAAAEDLQGLLDRLHEATRAPVIREQGAATGQRRALVIGIDTYDHLSPLAKAVNDAHAVAEALEGLDFTVGLAIGPDVDAFDAALEAFYGTLEPGDTAVFFFAGHGVADAETNYLLPADMPRLDSTENPRLARNAIDAGRVVDAMKARGVELALVVLDACRDNPFAHETVRGASSVLRGLRQIQPQQGAFVIYSAGLGQTALDRLSLGDPDPNSVFTRSFRPILETPGLPLVEIAKRTQVEVRALAQTVQHPQAPAYYDQVIGQFYFRPPAPRIFGLVIGIDAYRDPDLALTGAVNDARRLHEALRALGADEVTLITDRDARRQFLEFAWAQLVARAAPGDTLVLGFAGNSVALPIAADEGGDDDANARSFLLLAEAERAAAFRTTHGAGQGLAEADWAAMLGEVISASDMTAWMETAAARNLNVVVLVDGCYAGGMLLREFSNVTFIAATGPDGIAQERVIDGVQQGVASAAFAEALEGAADLNDDGYLTRSELSAYIDARVRLLAGSTRRGWDRQVPQFQPATDAADFIDLPLFQLPRDAAVRARGAERRAALERQLAGHLERGSPAPAGQGDATR